jgi:hypothetical protein
MGYLNLRPEQTNILFKLMEERYRQRATIITTNLDYASGATSLSAPRAPDRLRAVGGAVASPGLVGARLNEGAQIGSRGGPLLASEDGSILASAEGGIGRCCNAVGAPFVLLDAPDSLELEGLRCSGDETKLCCPYPPKASAIAVGTLVKVEDLLAKGRDTAGPCAT